MLAGIADHPWVRTSLAELYVMKRQRRRADEMYLGPDGWLLAAAAPMSLTVFVSSQEITESERSEMRERSIAKCASLPEIAR
jgi:hypothetical protein